MNRSEALQFMIQDYRRKIEAYQLMIEEWERELGQETSAQFRPEIPKETTKRNESQQKGRVAEVTPYQFWGKTQPEAAKMLLEFVGHPLKTDQIIEGIENGGIKIGGQPDKKAANIYSILRRNRDFAIVDRGAWGLTSWPGVKKKDSDDGDENEDKFDDKKA